MVETLINLSPILIFFSLGYGIKKTGLNLGSLPHRINVYAIRFIFPAVILLSVPKLEFSGSIYFAVLSPWLCVLIAAISVLLLSRALKWPREIEGALLILCALGNTGFLGVPMIKSLFGLEHVAIAAIYDQFGTFIALTTYATFVAALYSGDEKVDVKIIVKNVLLFPPFIALIVALCLKPDTLAPFEFILEIMSILIIPLTMLSIGMQFSFRVEQDILVPLAVGLGIKMLLLPLLIGLLGYTLAISTPVLQVAIFQSATPPMVTAAVLLISHKIAPKFTASVLGFGTLAALIWLPLVFIILNS
jgi:malate permease and related proteins